MIDNVLDELEDFSVLEKARLNEFRNCHICPDRKPHDRKSYETKLSFSDASGIGTNIYITCVRCGCAQDITDYGSW